MKFFDKLADGPVRTECLRIARKLVKGELKRSGVIISKVEASEITKCAIALINKDRSIFKQAFKEIRNRKLLEIDISKIPPRRKL